MSSCRKSVMDSSRRAEGSSSARGIESSSLGQYVFFKEFSINVVIIPFEKHYQKMCFNAQCEKKIAEMYCYECNRGCFLMNIVTVCTVYV